MTFRFILWLSLCGLVSGCLTAHPAQSQALPNLTRHTLSHGGLTRTYHLHRPSRLATTPAPIVFVLQGGGGAGAQELERHPGFAQLGEQSGSMPMDVSGSYPRSHALHHGGHKIPGSQTPKASRHSQKQVDGIQLTQVIWEFFARHRRR